MNFLCCVYHVVVLYIYDLPTCSLFACALLIVGYYHQLYLRGTHPSKFGHNLQAVILFLKAGSSLIKLNDNKTEVDSQLFTKFKRCHMMFQTRVAVFGSVFRITHGALRDVAIMIWNANGVKSINDISNSPNKTCLLCTWCNRCWSNERNILTHLHLDKMAAISQTTF